MRMKQETEARKETALPHGVMRIGLYIYEVLADATCICAENYQYCFGSPCLTMPCVPMARYAYSIRLILPGSDCDFPQPRHERSPGSNHQRQTTKQVIIITTISPQARFAAIQEPFHLSQRR